MVLKKVINQWKFIRVKNNARAYFCAAVLRDKNDYNLPYKKSIVAFLLDDHLYISVGKGVYPHTRYEFYAYNIKETGEVHYRADGIMFYKIKLANPF